MPKLPEQEQLSLDIRGVPYTVRAFHGGVPDEVVSDIEVSLTKFLKHQPFESILLRYEHPIKPETAAQASVQADNLYVAYPRDTPDTPAAVVEVSFYPQQSAFEYAVVVDTDHLRRGIARTLLGAAFRDIEQQHEGPVPLYATVNIQNGPIQKLISTLPETELPNYSLKVKRDYTSIEYFLVPMQKPE